MDIFTALQTAVSGLKAQSYAIGNISGNIANSQTTGYKRIDTSFVDLIAEQTHRREVAGTVLAQAQLTNTLQGNIASTGVNTNMAINGRGFFTVQSRTSDVSGQPAFSGNTQYTRRGDFALDKDGYLVNGAGNYLLGQNYDVSTGRLAGTGPIRVGNTTLAAKATTTITYGANLPVNPATTASATSKSSLYNPTDQTVLKKEGATNTPTQITSANASEFVNNSIEGPTVTAYTAAGAPVTVTTRWAKIQNASTSPAQNAVWNLFYASSSTAAAGSTAWTNAGTAFTFNGTGTLQSPTTGTTISALTVDGTNLGDIKLDFSPSTLTQYAASSGTATTTALSQDGYTAGTLNDIAVTEDGRITGSYTNGSVVTLANVGIVQFNNPDGLKPESGGAYAQTYESGAPLTGDTGAALIGGSVEQSNTDIAGEFSKMIVTQQAYSANTRVMSTAQTMMQDLLNVIR